MKKNIVIARFSFINENGLVISNGSKGTVLAVYPGNYYYDIEFDVDGDLIKANQVTLTNLIIEE